MGTSPKKKEKSLTDMMLDNMALHASIELSRDSSGRPDPRKARGIAWASGHNSLEERVKMEMMLDKESSSGTRTHISTRRTYSEQEEDSVSVGTEVCSKKEEWQRVCRHLTSSPISAEECELSEQYWTALERAKLSR